MAPLIEIKKWLEQSINWHAESTKNVCVFFHGFGGSPYDIYPLFRRLKDAHYTCLAPVIRGQRQMSRLDKVATAESIIEHTTELLSEVEQFRAEGQNIFVIGFSMGGALSIIQAMRIKPTAIILLAPYLGLKQGRWLLEVMGRPLAKIIPALPKLSEGRIASKEGAKKYQSGSRWLSLPAVLELEKIAEQAREALPKVTCPILWCHAPADPVADYHRVKAMMPSHAQHIECLDSQHVLLFDHDADLITQHVLEFIQQFSDDASVP